MSTRLRIVLASLLLLALGVASLEGVRHNGFTNYDDNEYITANPHVAPGLSATNLEWAFTRAHSNNWHPLTWLSHQLDATLFGLDPAAHHLSNLAYHLLATLLLFLLGLVLTREGLASFVVAALFAIHPMHVESVAWASERKDTLSACFAFACLLAYARYARHRSHRLYALVLLLLAGGLMSKPMLVTLPLVMLLLDLWPLQRAGSWQWRDWAPLVREKLPMFALVLASAIVTVLAQQAGGAVKGDLALPLGSRLANAATSVWQYPAKLLWPVDLAVLYPHPGLVETLEGPGPLAVAGSLLALVATSVGSVWLARRRGWWELPVGWFLYLVLLLPVVGLVQVGPQAMADRYSYLPALGLFLVLGAGLQRLAARGTAGRTLALVATAAILAACVPVTRAQVRVWESSETLWRHALAVTHENHAAHNNLGQALRRQGRDEEALVHYREAVRIRPDDGQAHFNLANTLAELGHADAARRHYATALRLDPGSAAALNNLGNEFAREGRGTEAIEMFQRAVQAQPALLAARENLARALFLEGKLGQARPHAEEAVKLGGRRNPEMLELLARLQGAAGDTTEAVATLREAIGRYEERGQPSDAQRLRELLSRRPAPPDSASAPGG